MSAAMLNLVLQWRIDRPMPHISIQLPGAAARLRTARGEAHDVAALLLTARGTGLQMIPARLWLLNADVLYLRCCLIHVHDELRVSRNELDHARTQLRDDRSDLREIQANRAFARAQLLADQNYRFYSLTPDGPAQ